MSRAFLVRYALPVVAAVLLVALVGVPYMDRLLTSWFESDVGLRARLVMNSVEQPLAQLLGRSELAGARNYLEQVSGDERLLGFRVCDRERGALLRTAAFPDAIGCDAPVGGPGKGGLVRLPSGPVEVARFPLALAGGTVVQVLVAHDLRYMDQRRSIARNLVLASVLVAAVALAALAGLGVRLLLNRWLGLLLGDLSERRFLDDAASPPATWPILRRVRERLLELEKRQRLEIDFRENWTPQALQQVAREQLEAAQLIVVSNREPYIHVSGADGQVRVQLPASGMVTALEPVIRACSGTWVAHGSGSADKAVVDAHDRIAVPPEQPSYTLRRVWLTPEQEEGYYYGFSNEGLWPLCHLAYVRPAFRAPDWQHYVEVNRRFAAAVAEECGQRNPVVLVQDFHFAMLPQLVREKVPGATIVLFWHIPWPNPETFGVCPWKRELLEHMLAADVVGFHTQFHCQNFLATLDRTIECHVNHENGTVTMGGHVCRVRAYPISIEWPPHQLAGLPSREEARRDLEARHGIRPGASLAIGVERWDFTKGILERFLALEHLFLHHREWLGRLVFLQVAAPSRSKLPAYQALQQQTLAEVKRINERFRQPGWVPIVLIDQHQEPSQVFNLYRAADICLVNSLHDGMNLVSKEFVAARDDEDGVLILSTFAGASRELQEALLVNPYDVPQTAAAVLAALVMPREQRRMRMQLMRRTVAEANVYRWAGRMLMDVARIRQRQLLEDWRRRS